VKDREKLECVKKYSYITPTYGLRTDQNVLRKAKLKSSVSGLLLASEILTIDSISLLKNRATEAKLSSFEILLNSTMSKVDLSWKESMNKLIMNSTLITSITTDQGGKTRHGSKTNTLGTRLNTSRFYMFSPFWLGLNFSRFENTGMGWVTRICIHLEPIPKPVPNVENYFIT